jgi:hypothetical protein
MREWFLLLLALACFISFFSKSSNLHFLILTFASILLFLFALYSPLLLSLFFIYLLFFIIIHFRRSFPVSFSSYYTVIHFSLSCFVSRLISFAFVQRTFFFFNINFSPLSTCTVHAFANTLEAARECRKKKTYCRSSFQTFNPFRVFHFPLNIPFVSRWSPPQIVRVNTFFDPKNKKLTL